MKSYVTMENPTFFQTNDIEKCRWYIKLKIVNDKLCIVVS